MMREDYFRKEKYSSQGCLVVSTSVRLLSFSIGGRGGGKLELE